MLFESLNTYMKPTTSGAVIAPSPTLRIEIKFCIREILVSIPPYRSELIECPVHCFDDAVERYLLEERINIPECVYTRTTTYCDEFSLSDLTYYMVVEFVDNHSKNKFKLTNPTLTFL